MLIDLAGMAQAEREALRAHLFLHAVLPLLEVVLDEVPNLARQFASTFATVQIETGDSSCGARLVFHGACLHVLPGKGDADLRLCFRDLSMMNRFFAGDAAAPPVAGALHHPMLMLRLFRLFGPLKMLRPGAAPGNADQRILHVKLLLRFATLVLLELNHGGHAGMRELAADSPQRVYQWSVAGTHIGAWLMMHCGEITTGTGTCPVRAPFVHFSFADVDTALAVRGAVLIAGSPEYSRKISVLLQQAGQLLLEG